MLKVVAYRATISIMTDYATFHRILENLIRFGTIAEMQHEPPRVNVQTGSILTTWLPWMAWRAGADQE
ncbi:phage baseplate assembly protein V [Pseudomonas sp. Y3 TE3536]